MSPPVFFFKVNTRVCHALCFSVRSRPVSVFSKASTRVSQALCFFSVQQSAPVNLTPCVFSLRSRPVYVTPSAPVYVTLCAYLRVQDPCMSRRVFFSVRSRLFLRVQDLCMSCPVLSSKVNTPVCDALCFFSEVSMPRKLMMTSDKNIGRDRQRVAMPS